MTDAQGIKKRVSQHYAQAVATKGSCCGGNDLVQLAGYAPEEVSRLPADAVDHSFGCGNPLAFAAVKPGEVVLDIGSGAGIDCLLAAERVGPEGQVIGVDMTPAMIEKANQNARAAGLNNVRFELGEAEALPVPDASVDWIVSNCVINLAPDKSRVFREAFRALRPGGRLSISDIVADLPRWLRPSSLYASCLSGALPEQEYLAALAGAGFRDIQVTARHRYDAEQLAEILGERRTLGKIARALVKSPLAGLARRLSRRVASIHIRAVKPLASEVAA
jgi:ubiquinone/menaquinone biosynthesis C-methylase UbiE